MTGPLGHEKAVKCRRYRVGQAPLQSMTLVIVWLGWHSHSGLELMNLSLKLEMFTLVSLGVN